MGLMDLIFPKTCLECKKEGEYICEVCLQKVGRGGWYKNTYSIFRYEGVIRKAIIALKYKYSTEIAKDLATVCVDMLPTIDHSLSTVLVPIPLHWYRKNFRGFNQSEEVGKIIAKKMNWNFEPNLLVKNVATKPQVGLKGESRRKNLSGVFTLNPNYVLSTMYSVLLFDDVFTTGSTIGEATEVLNENGLDKVWGLTIAR